MIKIAIGCDHIVTDLKNHIRDWLIDEQYDVIDCGTYDFERTHYPIYGKRVADLVTNKIVDFGIVICGTAVGITNAAQKVPNARVVLARDVATVKRARNIYDANILGFGGRIVGKGLAEDMVETFLEEKFISTNDNLDKINFINDLLPADDYYPNSYIFEKYRDKWDNGDYHD